MQRVTKASVSVDETLVGSIDSGLVILVGISKRDTISDANYIVSKTVNLRIFDDEQGRFNYSALDMKSELLIISQFTLYGDTRKGRRPSFVDAASPDEAKTLFVKTLELFSETGLEIATGQFQAYMSVSIENDGPVTIIIDSPNNDLGQLT